MSNEKKSSVGRGELKFNTPRDFQAQANLGSFAAYRRLYTASVNNPEKFWAAQAEKFLLWRKKWKKVLQWKAPFSKWFIGGKLNVAENCLDRHLGTDRENKAAIIFEGEPGDQRTLTYKQLHLEVCKCANALEGLGLGQGDRVAIYLPMVPEAAIAMLACARIGAIHTVIFGGFSSEAIKDRVNDCKARLVITADGGWRRGKIVKLKENVDAALKGTPSVEHVLVLKRTGDAIAMKKSRDLWWHDTVDKASHKHQAPALDAETPLFILYTSGSTGKPKGVLHTTGGYLLWVTMTAHYIFDLKEKDTFWCSADIGWVTGHSYVVYGILSNGATSVMYEGAPNHPDVDRFWSIVDRHKVSIFYTAPTAIRAFMRWGEEHPKKHDLSSLRLLGTVGEPINPEAWLWYHRVVGGKRCPIVDTWWQTETGGMMIAPFPGAVPQKPGSATVPFFGIVGRVVDDKGKTVPKNASGKLVIDKPWPAMLRTLWGDDERYQRQYWTEFPGIYNTGDGCRQDQDGYFWIVGRIDDVLNVSGHRIGTAEIESALVSHKSVAEAAAVGRPDDLKGQALVVFVTLKNGIEATDALKDELRQHVAREIGPFARPDTLRFAAGLPKTRSGKIMRRLLKEIAGGGEVKGDTTTLEDFSVVEALKKDED